MSSLNGTLKKKTGTYNTSKKNTKDKETALIYANKQLATETLNVNTKRIDENNYRQSQIDQWEQEREAERLKNEKREVEANLRKKELEERNAKALLAKQMEDIAKAERERERVEAQINADKEKSQAEIEAIAGGKSFAGATIINQTPPTQGMSKRTKIILGSAIGGTLVLGLGLFFGLRNK